MSMSVISIRTPPPVTCAYARVLANPKVADLSRPNPTSEDLRRLIMAERGIPVPSQRSVLSSIAEEDEEDQFSSVSRADDAPSAISDDEEDDRTTEAHKHAHRHHPKRGTSISEAPEETTEGSEMAMSVSIAPPSSEARNARSHAPDQASVAPSSMASEPFLRPKLYKEGVDAKYENFLPHERRIKLIRLNELKEYQDIKGITPSRQYTMRDSLEEIEAELDFCAEQDSVQSKTDRIKFGIKTAVSWICGINSERFNNFLPIEGVDTAIVDELDSKRLDGAFRQAVRKRFKNGAMAPESEILWGLAGAAGTVMAPKILPGMKASFFPSSNSNAGASGTPSTRARPPAPNLARRPLASRQQQTPVPAGDDDDEDTPAMQDMNVEQASSSYGGRGVAHTPSGARQQQSRAVPVQQSALEMEKERLKTMERAFAERQREMERRMQEMQLSLQRQAEAFDGEAMRLREAEARQTEERMQLMQYAQALREREEDLQKREMTLLQQGSPDKDDELSVPSPPVKPLGEEDDVDNNGDDVGDNDVDNDEAVVDNDEAVVDNDEAVVDNGDVDNDETIVDSAGEPRKEEEDLAERISSVLATLPSAQMVPVDSVAASAGARRSGRGSASKSKSRSRRSNDSGMVLRLSLPN